MKKVLISLLSLGALLLTAGCAKELVGPDASGDTVQATFTVAVPDGVATKAVSDGTSAGKLEFAVYDASGNYLSDLSTSATIASGAAKHWTVTVRLVKGLTYDFAFFAHSSADGGYYTFSGVNKTITADYTKLNANDDKADSFYAVLDDVTIADANLSQNVTLTRPVAQVNVACPNEDHTAAGYSFKMDTRTTQMVLTNISNTFNLFDGTVSGATTDATLDYAAPNDDNITVSTVDYKRQAMAYVLVGADQTTDVTFRAKAEGKEDDTEKTIVRSITNVPLKTNYRTNILGNIYTSAVQFDIVVDEDFNVVDEYADDNFPTYASIADLNTAFAAGKGIGYTVAVVPAAAVTGAQTITLPDTDDEVSIFFRGNFSAADITIEYSSVAEAKKPSKLTIEAPRVGGATKSINKLIGNLPATTVVLTGTTGVDEAEFHTASSTLQITKDAKILNKLTVYAGSLVVEGFIETAVIDPAVAVNTVDAVATVKEDGEVVRFVVQNLNAVIEEGAKVGTLEVSTTDDFTGAAPTVTIEGGATVAEIVASTETGSTVAPTVAIKEDAEVGTVEQKGAAVVDIAEDAQVGDVEAEDISKIEGDGAGDVEFLIKNEAQLTDAIEAKAGKIKIGENFSVNRGYELSSDLEIDMNSYTITFTGETLSNYPSQRAFKVVDGASLNIHDGSILLTEHDGNTSSTNLWGSIRFESSGNLTLRKMVLDNYCENGLNIKMTKGYAYLYDVTVNSKYGGAIEVGGVEGDPATYATADIEECHFTNESTYDWCSTTVATCYNGIARIHSGAYSGYYGVYVFSSGGAIYIEDGCTVTGTQAALVANKDQSHYPAYNDANVYVSGGVVNGGYLVDNAEHAHISLTGGSYSVDPAAYVTGDYSVMEKDGRYLVGIFPKTIDISTADEFNAVFSDPNTKSKNTQININADIDLTNEAAHTTFPIQNTDACSITVNGNGHTIKGMQKPLFGYTFVASISVNNLTFKDCVITEDYTGYAAVLVSYFDAGKYLNVENVTIDNCKVTGSNYVGAIYGAGGGYGNQSDGPVHMGAVVKNCTISNCEFISTGEGSVGAIAGHAAWNNWTKLTVEGSSVEGCTLTTGKSSKAGSYFGTVGISGGTVYGRDCGIYVKNCTWSDNSAMANNVKSPYIFGRVAQNGGELYVWENSDYVLAAHNYGSGDVVDRADLVTE